jgi:uncharacterized repeat protein (TIGR01451 family)
MNKTNRIPMRATRFTMAIVAGLLTLPALAAGLRVTATDSALPPSAVVAGAFGFSVVNEGTTTFDSVRLVADPGHVLQCADLTAQSRSFAIGGLLRAGDRVTCTTQPVAGAQHGAGVSVIARSGSASPQERHVTFTARPAATPSQGIVVLVAGAVLQDTNADGNLDVGETIAYDYSAINLGTLALSGLAVTDNDGTVSCPQTTLAPGANMVCTSNHAIDATEAGAGIVANLVDISGTDGAGPITGGDFIVTFNLGGTAGIRMFKSPLLFDDVDSSGYASAGDLLRYTFVVKNSNAQALSAVNVVEPDPTRIDTPITCAATTLGGQVFAGLGSGVLQSNDVVLCTADYTITAADASSGSADNLAESSGQPPIGTLASGTGASAVVIPTPADVTIVKTLVGESGSQSGIAEPGESLSYTITLTNAGGADAINYGVIDQLDPNVVFASADNGGSLVGGSVIWSGLTVPAGGSLTLGVVVTVVDPIPPGVTGIANVAYQTGTTPPPCPPAGPQCVETPTVGAIAIAKALTGESGSQAGIAEPGETLTYTITLTNTGGTAVTGFGVTDPLDTNVSFVSADNGGVNSAGVVTWSGLTIPANGNLVLTVVVIVSNPVPIGIEQITNLAYNTGTPPPDCTLQPTPAACVITPVATRPRLSVTKTADTSEIAPGGTINYLITVTNVGTVVATNVIISDPLPAGIASFTWTCAANGGATCPNASGSGAINEQVPTFPVGAQLIYSVQASVTSTPMSQILNLVTVTPSVNTVCVPSQTAPPCQASVPVAVFVPVPINSKWMLLMILLVIGGSALVAIRRV